MTKQDWVFLKPLASLSDFALLTTRLLSGIFLIHGVWDNIVDPARMNEFIHFLTAIGFAAPTFMAPLSVYAQFLIGLALIAGLLTRWAGLLLAFNFLIGLIMAHWDQSLREQWPAAVLIALGLLFATIGAGKISLDHILEKRFR